MWAPCKHRSYFALTRPRPAFQRPELIIASFGIGAAKGCSPSPKWRKSNAKRGNSVAISSRPLLQDDPETALRRAASLSPGNAWLVRVLPFLMGSGPGLDGLLSATAPLRLLPWTAGPAERGSMLCLSMPHSSAERAHLAAPCPMPGQLARSRLRQIASVAGLS